VRPAPQEKPEICQNPRPLVLPELPETRSLSEEFRVGIALVSRGKSMPFVKCSVDGCNRKLQPILKVDPRDRDTWLYRECDVCLKPVCEKHSAEGQGRIICDRCRREAEAQQRSAGLIDLGFRLPREPE
jgi:hypothetical protein